MINSLIRVFKRYEWFKRFNAKVTYELLAKYIPAEDWRFMNYGYVPAAEETPLQLPANFTNQPLPLQMYHYLGIQRNLQNKTVLEVGSGRGGGANYLATQQHPARYVALDLAQNAIDLCRKLYSAPNLEFVQGSAEALPFANESFDVVVNVESSHAYGNVPNFLSEVRCVLRPGGSLLVVDFRNQVAAMDDFRAQIQATGLIIRHEENISARVIQAIEAEDPAKRARIEKLVPKRWQALFAQFAGVVGSPFYNTLKEGTRVYHRFVIDK
jgi:ubiquinone/menaquinone biosynthesis C-methylase UbiE